MTRRAVLLAGAALAAFAPVAASVPGGAPRLEDFRIDDRGTVTRPAPPTPAPAPPPSPAPVPPPTAEPQAEPAPAPTASRRVADPPASRPAEPRATPSAPTPPPAAVQAPPETATPDPVESAPVPVAPAPAPSVPAISGERPPTPNDGGPVWPWLLIPAALAALGGVAWARRRRPAATYDSIEIVDEAADAPAFAPAVAPAPAPRPRVELALDPEGATLQDGALEVKFVLKIANTGDAAAANIRVASKLLSGGREVEDALAEFYADPLLTAPRLANVPAGQAGGLRGRVRMGADALRTLLVKDRALLVPVVAVSLRYDWDGGEGQTAQSFVVGRELDPPAERMAALPANAQPRVYRGLGTRPHALAKVA